MRRILTLVAQAGSIGFSLYWLGLASVYWPYNLTTRHVAYVAFIESNQPIAYTESALFVFSVLVLAATLISKLYRIMDIAYQTGKRSVPDSTVDSEAGKSGAASG